MPSSDDRLAPVSYLPGVLPPSGGPSASAGPPHPGPPAPVAGAGAGTDAETGDRYSPRSDEPIAATNSSGRAGKAGRRAENVSMAALTRRGMSRRELERVLLSRELDETTVAAELDRLQGVGLLDDRALAYDLVSRLRDRKGLGRTAVAAELSRRLLPNEVIGEALETIESDAELETARELAVRRAGQLRSLDRATAERRLSGFLQRRGYSGDIVRTAVDEALRGAASGRSGVTFR